jgi:hypothetical protein
MIKVASLFSQLLRHFPRTEFAHFVAKYEAEKRAKGFTCWTQLVSMLFCHVAHADSPRCFSVMWPTQTLYEKSVED